MVAQLALKYVSLGVKSTDIAVIAPYRAQVAAVTARLHNRDPATAGVSIHSVDGFQGKEKELVLMTFVRSNPAGEVGFLKESRRLNVIATRAKRSFIMIGDSKTLVSDPVIASFIEFLKENNAIIPAEDVF